MKQEDLKRILAILNSSFVSEQIDDYADEDFSFGPSLGHAVREGKLKNIEIKNLITLVENEIKKDSKKSLKLFKKQ